jgi:DNA (cytosine-5)-methyltransferase 1
MRLGSLCTGVGGIELGLGIEPVWVADNNKYASKLLDIRHPSVPNLGDLTTIDWMQVEWCNILTAGYPCQPFSNAGLKKGINDERHIFPFIAEGIRILRPDFVILENVRGHLRQGLQEVLGEFAHLGYAVRWGVVRASDAGAPHKRERIFIVAAHPQREFSELSRELGKLGGPSFSYEPLRNAVTVSNPEAASYAYSLDGQWTGGPTWRGNEPTDGREAVSSITDTSGFRLQGSEEFDRLQSTGEEALNGWQHLDGRSMEEEAFADASVRQLDEVYERQRKHLQLVTDIFEKGEEFNWGEFGPAIRQWELISGREAPLPLDDKSRLVPAFAEWMMGLPEGWITDVPVSRTQQLKMIGNAVCPQQCRLAVELLTM